MGKNSRRDSPTAFRAPKAIEHNPESVPPLKDKHVRVLQRMLNDKLGKYARGVQNDFIKAEIGALHAAIAALNELLEREESQ